MKMMLNRASVLVLGLSLCLSCRQIIEPAFNHVAIHENDSEDEIIWKAAHVVPSQRQFKWQQLELTAFAHFGLNTFADRQWGSGNDDPALFNPAAFDAEQWVKVLKDAGFKSLILTCKHHDGFCLWPSAYTNYSVAASPWMDGKGDVVKAVSDACSKFGLLFGFYLSPWDRHDSRYGTAEYNDYFVKQLTELLTQYGPIYEVWFDGACGEGPNGKRQEYDFERWYRTIRKYQPECVIAIMGPDVRWVGNEKGISRESEWSVVPNNRLDPALIAADSQQELIMPPTRVTRDADLASREIICNARTLVWYPAEADVSIRPSWFYTDADNGRTKSAERLMDIYFTSVGRNSNLLLNIPPNKEGLFGDDEVKSLLEFARLREQTFADNYMADADVKIEGLSAKTGRKICDSDYNSSVTLKRQKDKSFASIGIKLAQKQEISIVLLQEDIRKGQRVESFILEYKDAAGQWQTAASGSTIGYKRLLNFPAVETEELRLSIKEARHNPVIAEMGLF